MFNGRTHVKLKLQHFGHLMGRANSLEKSLMLGKTKGKKRRGQEKGMTEEEMPGWHQRLNWHMFEQAPDGDGQGSLACCSPWGHRVRHYRATEQQ